MRRSPIVVTATAAGLAGVLGFKPHEPSLPGAAAASPTSSSSSGTTRASGSTGSSGSSARSARSARSGTATGAAIATRYGNAQVKVTVKDGRITDVEALQLQGNDPKSVQISSSAEPALKASALQKQTAAVDTVSGATITSASYAASLQSALDKLGFNAADGSRGSSDIPQVQEHDGGPPQDGGFFGSNGPR